MAALNLLVTEQLDSRQLLVLFYFGILFYSPILFYSILFYYILVYMHMYFGKIMDGYTFTCWQSRNSGSLNLLEAQRPVETCTGIA